jgi:hypothetical protein
MQSTPELSTTSQRERLDDETFEILNAIYLHKMASPEHISDVTGVPLERVEAVLKDQADKAAVLDLDGSFLLGEEGTSSVLAYYRASYAPLRADREIVEWYEKFESALNRQFIKAVSDWQTSDGDARAQEKMAKLVERMIRHLDATIPRVPRYERYSRRFARAMARADRGELDFVCKPTVDSMHNIWFEFHEDILAVVGRPRDV